MSRVCFSINLLVFSLLLALSACVEQEEYIPVESVSLSVEEAELVVGESLQLSASVKPSDATEQELLWDSSDELVAKVSNTGMVTAESEGVAIITATVGKKKATCQVAVKKPFVEVADIILDNESITLEKGNSIVLTADVYPDDATDKTVSWICSDDKVATVDQDGRVTAIGGGVATVTASAGSKSAACVIEVIVPVESVKLSQESIALYVGDEAVLTASILPSDATDQSVVWTSSEDDVVAVDENGKVTALKEGSATITARAGDETSACVVTVAKRVIEVSSLEINKSSITLEPGAAECLTVIVHPADASDYTIVWSSSDEDVAVVDLNGNVSAIKEGDAVITVAAGGKQAECAVTVKSSIIRVESISLDKTSIKIEVGSTDCLTATVSPDTATDKSVRWSSTNPDIASVDQAGNVTAKSVGMVTITATTNDGDFLAGCEVEVYEPYIPVSSISLDIESLTIRQGTIATITATVLPDNASNKTVMWLSSDENVARVLTDGRVIALQEGNVIITAVCGNCSSTCEVTVTGILAESISLNKTMLDMEEGDTDELSVVSFEPTNVSDKTVEWSSSDNTVATIDENGIVTAKAMGIAIITATATSGGCKAECEVVVWSSDGDDNGFTWVDLGLPSGRKWATCNVGASTPEGFGDYYAWGETEPKANYDRSTYKYYGLPLEKMLHQDKDAAWVSRGGLWRMPIDNDVNELVENCEWQITTRKGVLGCRFVSKSNGHLLFIPFASHYQGTQLFLPGDGMLGYYWLSTGQGHTAPLSSNRNADTFSIVNIPSCSFMKEEYGAPIRPVNDTDSRVPVQGVSLINDTNFTASDGSVSMMIGETMAPRVEFSPYFATDKSLSWTSDNSSVVSVDENGIVTANNKGTATIRVETNDGGFYKEMTINVWQKNGYVNGHQWVDLGLPSGIKWATCNLGAENPDDFGDYYTWGDINPYNGGGYCMFQGEVYPSKYCITEGVETIDNKTRLELQDDAAFVNWGDGWRIPSYAEIKELLNYCNYTDMYYGCKLTSNVNGNSICFPYSGTKMSSGNIVGKGISGDCWSATLYGDATIDFQGLYPDDAVRFYPSGWIHSLCFDSGGVGSAGGVLVWRFQGHPIRPVSDVDCRVEVASLSLEKNDIVMMEGDTLTLTSSVLPENATFPDVIWSSTDKSVASISVNRPTLWVGGILKKTFFNGFITALSPGETDLVATSYDGRLSSVCHLTVVPRPIVPVSLNKELMFLVEGESEILSATIVQGGSTEGKITWESGNTDVATVDQNGIVHALGAGTTTITAFYAEGGDSAVCSVTVISLDCVDNGHPWVDLGLPSGLKWATCNLGASSMEDIGDRYAWGETRPKSNYTWANYRFVEEFLGPNVGDIVLSKYDSAEGKLELEDDAARVNWNGGWRMPESKDWRELLSNCTYRWARINGVNGLLLRSKINENILILPATSYDNQGGSYWSATIGGRWSAVKVVFDKYALDNHVWFDNIERCYGGQIRPVRE